MAGNRMNVGTVWHSFVAQFYMYKSEPRLKLCAPNEWQTMPQFVPNLFNIDYVSCHNFFSHGFRKKRLPVPLSAN